MCLIYLTSFDSSCSVCKCVLSAGTHTVERQHIRPNVIPSNRARANDRSLLIFDDLISI